MRNARKTTPGPTASLLFGNLASNGRHVAYIHNTEVIIVPEAAVQQGSGHPTTLKLVDMNSALVQQVRWVQLPEVELLVVASQRSLQFYSADGKRLLQHIDSPPTASTDMPSYFKGISACSLPSESVVCVGSSAGSVLIQPLPGGEFGEALFYDACADAIVDLSAASSEEDALVAVADASGSAALFHLGAGVWERCARACTPCALQPPCFQPRARSPSRPCPDCVRSSGPVCRGYARHVARGRSDGKAPIALVRRRIVDFPSEVGTMCTALRLRGSQLFCAYSSGCVAHTLVGA